MDENDKTALTDRIAELESLLLAQREATLAAVQSTQSDGVPILDELITDEEEDYYPELPLFEDEDEDDIDEDLVHDARITQIADELEQKLTRELDEIVNLLKTNMRESIINELQTLLHNEPEKKTEG
jgi:hypothetical protein